MKTLKHLFTALLLLCCLTATAHDFEVDGIYYNITDATNKTVEVTYQGDYYYSYDNEYTGNVVIPESFISNGKSYTVTSIEHDAFAFCSGLTSIVIPGSVTSIGDAAFNRCYSLKELHIADGEGTLNLGYSYIIDNTGKPLFYDCPLETLYLGRDLDYSGKFTPSPFNDKTTLTSVTIGNRVTSIGNYAFYDCSGLTSIEIPNSVISIGNYAFYDCSCLTSVEIPNSVRSIGSDAFYGTAWYNNQPDGVVYTGKVLYKYKGTMPENTSIVIEDGTLEITDYAFENCNGLASIEIPNSIISIGKYTFKKCKSLASIKIPNSVTSIGEAAFEGCTGLTSIEISNSVKSIDRDAFKDCSSLTAVHISDLAAWCNIDFYNSDANPLFYAKNLHLNAKLLTELSIPTKIVEVKNYAFYNCTNIKSITIHDGIKAIGKSAFSGCSKVETIYIGNSIENIKDYAFANCNNIFEIEIASKKAITASKNVFSNDAYNNVCLYVPKGRKFAYERTTPWNNFYIVEKDLTGNRKAER